MYDIPENSLEPIKRQEKELKMYYDSASRPLDVEVVEEVSQVYDNSGKIIFKYHS